MLVVRLDSVGDVILTLPFLRALRENLPRARITLLVRPETANLVELCPYVDEVLAHEPATSRPGRSLQALARTLRLARRHLWARRFDLAIVPRWDVDSQFGVMTAYLSRARQRLGYSESVSADKSRLNPGLDRLLTHPVRGGAPRHEVQRNLDLIAAMGGKAGQYRLELWCADEDERFADRLLQAHGATDRKRLVAIAPGAGHPKRMWPLARFAELGAWLTRQLGATLVVIGNQAEEPLGRQLRIRLGAAVINAAGRTSLREAGALLRRCRLFIGNDSGPLHLAAAAGLPVIEISCHPLGGSTQHANSPARFGPWGVPRFILRPSGRIGACSEACAAEVSHCIERISVAQVQSSLRTLLPHWVPVHE